MSAASVSVHNNWAIGYRLQELREFRTHGKLRGGYRVDTFGKLPKEHWPSFERSSYVVYSYYTPIAWYVPAASMWVVPEVFYSQTTSKHQNTIRSALFYTGQEVSKY